jgi:hypothetical protein
MKKNKVDLAKILKGTTPEKLRSLLVKSHMVTFRVSESDAAAMDEMARSCGLTRSEYLVRLHCFALSKLRVKNE